ncbi:hypothetical protein PR048_009717 [Dryococelus australis]|uniref:RNA-directed DNA polymerase n=1 Tax=Dryococelus australis TaxID=614101 RepID=A0ABQ9I0R4_9NEOP|nr:hypothetical protein PR048_009717 [Dryococelus australis]
MPVNAQFLLKDGMSADPDKVATIVWIKNTRSVQELQRFLGMITYLAKFIPQMSKLAFKNLKESLEFFPVLRFYDHTKPVTLSVDASSHSVASVLLQGNHPVCYASKLLTKAQLNYSQLKKEALAILVACKKFHGYICGNQNVLVDTDHKPLEPIFMKPLLDAPARLQRILFEVFLYNPVVTYKNGSELYVADALSRDCGNCPEPDAPPTFDVQVVIPMSKESTLRLAREHVFWDRMTQDVTEYVRKCATEEEETPPVLGCMLRLIYLFQLKGKDYLIVADSYSGYFDFVKLSSTTSEHIIAALKRWFSQHVIPDKLHTDGGPRYTSHEFEQFRRKWNFTRADI